MMAFGSQRAWDNAYRRGRCQAIRKDGHQCEALASSEGNYCPTHRRVIERQPECLVCRRKHGREVSHAE